jgi:hypothetical protein
MRSDRPFIRLRWYEHWMLCFLARSPRIRRIIVEQDAPPEPGSLDVVPYLERLYRASGPSEERQG